MLKGEWFANLLLPNTAKNQRGNRERKIITSLIINATGVLRYRVPTTGMRSRLRVRIAFSSKFQGKRRKGGRTRVRKLGHRAQALDPGPLLFKGNCLACDLWDLIY